MPTIHKGFETFDPFNISKRNFIVIAHRAVSNGNIQLNDLCGASGRWDGIARSITASLFLSHDMRRDTCIHILLLGPGDPPKVLTIEGLNVKYLNPDERACSALMKKNLSITIGEEMDRTVKTSPGIYITRGRLGSLLDRINGSIYLMKEGGLDAGEVLGGKSDQEREYFILSDDREFEDDELKIIRKKATTELSVGPLPLHTYQTIVLVNNILDIGEVSSS